MKKMCKQHLRYASITTAGKNIYVQGILTECRSAVTGRAFPQG